MGDMGLRSNAFSTLRIGPEIMARIMPDGEHKNVLEFNAA